MPFIQRYACPPEDKINEDLTGDCIMFSRHDQSQCGRPGQDTEQFERYDGGGFYKKNRLDIQ